MRTIQRFTDRERAVHWTVAILFILAGLSGLAFFHPSLYWLSELFGGGAWTRILHPFIGVAMALVFIYPIVHYWRSNRLDDSDRAWLARSRTLLANREEEMPAAGRFNAAQKLVFWTSVVCVVTLLVTGLIFWRPWFAHLYPITLVRLATLVHSVAAFVMIVLILLHIYSAIWVRGSIRGMMTGRVSEAWAKKHHPAWHRELTR
jgi:formate dehydrogenase subunit gamma